MRDPPAIGTAAPALYCLSRPHSESARTTSDWPRKAKGVPLCCTSSEGTRNVVSRSMSPTVYWALPTSTPSRSRSSAHLESESVGVPSPFLRWLPGHELRLREQRPQRRWGLVMTLICADRSGLRLDDRQV